MAAKSLPGSEDTTADQLNWLIKEGVEGASHIIFPAANVLQDYDQYDMIVSVPWCGLIDNGVDSGNEVSVHVGEAIQIDSAEIEAGATFTAFGQEVWYNAVTKEYTDTEAEDLYLVGYVILATNTDGIFRFEKVRQVTEGEAT